jgi:NAD(P)-dependent dehydrogenase (short-subunit alcohol dehydrogenase family)
VTGLIFYTIPETFAAGEEKAVLVTGASSGIGRKITEHLAGRGYFVYAGARKAKDLDELNKIENVQSIRLDVTIQEDIDSAVNTVAEAGRGLYGLVNNAGVAVVGDATKMTVEDLIFTMDVNVYGPYRITTAFAPLIIESKGRITTIGSISGILSSRRLASYSMSKHAIEAYTDSLAAEMEDHGVQVSVVEPGNYQSRIRFKVLEHAKEQGASEEEMAGLRNWANADHKDPDEVADAVHDALFAENPKRRYMVVPNDNEAEITIRQIMKEMVELNQDQPYTYDRETLIKMLDETISAVTSAKNPG